MAKIKPISTVSEWQALWEAQQAAPAGALLVFKRSPICPTSHFVEGVFTQFIAGLPDSADLTVVSVDVIGARSVSQRVAADTGIRHESPQVLLIGAGQKILWHDSHGGIDEEALRTHLAT